MNLIQSLRGRLNSMRMSAMMARVARDNSAFDASYGVETAGQVLLDEYDLAASETQGAEPYQPVHENVLRRVIAALGDGVASYEFLDIGSGKGKALLVASTYPFRRVRGVELSPRLNDVARRNIEGFAARGEAKCRDVSAICMDARGIDDLSGPTLVFLFNPFGDEVMREVVGSLERCARAEVPILVAYLAPRARAAFDQSSVFTPLVEAMRLCVYASRGAAISPSARDELTRLFNTWRV